MFIFYILMYNAYGFKNFFIGVFIFTLTIGLSIMALCFMKDMTDSGTVKNFK